MTEKRFVWNSNDVMIDDNVTNNQLEVIDITEIDILLGVMNKLHEENMDLRVKHTQSIIIMKDVVRDLKRMDTYRYAEHLEKIANLHFLSEQELKE